MGRVELPLSNLMAYDAVAQGPFVEWYPLNHINEVFDAARHHRLLRRAGLVPGMGAL